MKQKPIGIVDSGVGGLSIWQELVRQLPHEAMVYVADSAYCPYGERNPQEIYQLAKRIVTYLIEVHQVKLIVIACNTVTVSCLELLRTDFPNTPIVGIVPVVKTAVLQSKNKKIGILSTKITAESTYQNHLIDEFAQNCLVINIGTNSLVPLVEKGEIIGQEVHTIVAGILQKFQEEKVDTIALGCSHFPFLRETMQEILGDKVLLLDSASAVGRQVQRILEKNKQESTALTSEYVFFTTGNKDIFARVAKQLLHDTMAKRQILIEHVELKLYD